MRQKRILPPGCLLALCLMVAACHTGPVVTAFDGTYTGVASNITNGVYDCADTRTANPMIVSGGAASFGQFSGWVAPDGALQMQSDANTLSGTDRNSVTGRFSGYQFVGELKLGHPAGFVCTYHLALSR